MKEAIILKKHEEKKYNAGKVIFRQGDSADCMYRVAYGLVDIYMNYKQDNQRLLATVQPDEYFGEMAMIDDTVRSATAVSRTDETVLIIYPKEELPGMLENETPVFMDLLNQMAGNLVRLTDSYMDVCRTIAAYKECDENGKEIDGELQKNIDRYAGMAKE